MLDEASPVRPTPGDFVEFAHTGTAADGDYHCSACGYGISVRAFLPQCPMCAGTIWEPVTWTPPKQRFQA